jgi:serine/threonine protein kinase
MTHDSPQDSLLGLQLDEYRVEELLGQGGMARVYRGLDTRVNRYVAIKVIDASLRADSEYRLRFEREAQAIAKLEHPNIVHLYRYGEAQDVLYMAMQYVEGADLGFVLNDYRLDDSFIEPEEAIRIIRQLGQALDYAHSQGVIHRDIKPTNIMLNKQGQVLLADFGLALLTEIGTRGEIFGSPHYIAPEQAISSAGAVPQSDLYSVGVILYEMFTGALPYDAENPMDIALLHMEGNLTPPHEMRSDISEELSAVVLKAMAREPENRYSTGAVLADALVQALSNSTVNQPSAPSTQRHLSIPERVAIELEANPLPPIPAEVAPLTEPPTKPASVQPPPMMTPPPAPPSASPTRPQRQAPALMPMLAGIAGGIVLVLAAAAVIAYLLIGDGDDDNDASDLATIPVASDQTVIAQQQTATWTPPPTLTATFTEILPITFSPAPTNTALVLPTQPFTATFTPALQPSVIPSASPTSLPTLTLAPTITPAPLLLPVSPTVTEEIVTGYGLLVARNGLESIFIINGTQGQAFPLELLRIGDGADAISGNEWGIELLQQGECVTVWRAGSTPQPPDVTCTPVGEPVIRSATDDFEALSLAFYYDDRLVTTCEKERCFVRIMLGVDQVNESTSTTEYELLFIKEKEDSLFVVNLSPGDFPLTLLNLENKDGSVNGADWGITALRSGECVAIWKDSGNPKTPKDLECIEVGEHLDRSGKERFWKSSFTIYFQGDEVANCDKNSCTVTIDF